MESKFDAIDKVYIRIEKLKEYVAILERFKDTRVAQLEKDAIIRGAIERYLQLAIEACIDIAELIISDQRLKTPQTAKEAIEILGKHGVINESFAKEFAKAAGFRNILIHDYVDINYTLLLKNLKTNLSDFHRFIKEVVTFLK